MTAIDSHEAAESVRSGPGEVRPTRSAFRRHLWLVLLATYCLGFGLLSILRVVIQDQSLTVRIPLPQYQLLRWHVIFGSVAMCLAWLQVWPWLRNNHWRAHRRIGRIYIFAGVIPAGLLAIPVSMLAGVGHAYRMSLFTLAVLWLTATLLGFRAVRRKQYLVHRRWMLRSVALTTAIISARPLTGVNWLTMASFWPDVYGTTADNTYNEALTSAMWGAVVLHLVIVEWVVLRPQRRANIDVQLLALGGAR